MIDQQTSDKIAALVRQSGEEPRFAVETKGCAEPLEPKTHDFYGETWTDGPDWYDHVVVVATDTRLRIYKLEAKGKFKKKVVISAEATFHFDQTTSPGTKTPQEGSPPGNRGPAIKSIHFICHTYKVWFIDIYGDPSWDQFVSFWKRRMISELDRRDGNINKLS